MNTTNVLRRLSPLALILIALTALLAPTPSARAQSSVPVQIRAHGTGDPSLAARAEFDGKVRFKADNNNDFRQRWQREQVTTGVFRFALAGTNSCIRIPNTLPAGDVAEIAVGSCSGTGAQWRRVAVSGPGDYYRNVATSHHLSTDLCIFETCSDKMFAMPGEWTSFLPDLPRITLEFL
ncbi:MAG TPA: hypothetical protein VFZ00_00975 [Solirubrobacter sp.]|nr:hypothetical protein [Solirubrobacter sp.]